MDTQILSTTYAKYKPDIFILFPILIALVKTPVRFAMLFFTVQRRLKYRSVMTSR